MITHIVSDWLFSPCCVEHQDEFIFERVAVAYSRDYNQGSKCPSLPGLTHWVNPGLPGLGFKPYFGKVGNTGE